MATFLFLFGFLMYQYIQSLHEIDQQMPIQSFEKVPENIYIDIDSSVRH